jgi:hypothetical protein
MSTAVADAGYWPWYPSRNGRDTAPDGGAPTVGGKLTALAGELIQSLDRDIDADAEAPWSEGIRARLDRLDEAVRTIPWSEARRRISAAARRGARA